MHQAPFKGYTLLEWLIVVAVTAILLAVTTPATYAWLARHRLIGAAETLAGQLLQARGEAIRRRERVLVHFEAGIHWCAATSVQAPCDCRFDAAAKAVPCNADATVTQATDFPGVEIAGITFPGDTAGFDPVRGTARPGTIRLAGHRGAELRVVLSLLGRLRICAVPGPVSFPRYPAC